MGIDIALAVATDLEWKAVIDCGLHFERPDKIKTTFKQCLQARTADGLEIVAVLADHMGQVNASITACKLVYELQPFLIISIGVAAGLPKKTALFDVLIPEIVHDVSLGKVEINPKTKELEFKYDHRPGSCDRDAAADLKVHFERHYHECYDHGWFKHPKLIEKNKKFAREHWNVPTINKGDVLCDNLVRNDAYNLIKSHGHAFRNVVGCEMESFGFTEAIRCVPQHGPLCQPKFAMVKGVVDFALKKDSYWQPLVAGSVSKCIHSYLTKTFPRSGLMSLISLWRSERNKRTRQRVLNLVANHQKVDSEIQNTVGANLIDVALLGNEHLIDGTFSVNVDSSSRYLDYAKPIFSNATHILATSIDSVSKFWTSKETIQLARDYLDAQASNRRKRHIVRIFVFHSAAETHRYGRVLDAHLKAYENVYVCSAEDYQALIKDAVTFHKPEDALTTDFALLAYTLRLGGASPKYLGTLGSQQFTFFQFQGTIKVPGVGKFDADKLNKVFKLLEDIKKGQIESIKAGVSGVNVLAWSDGIWEKGNWAAKLRTLFPGDDREAMHMVFLGAANRLSETELLELKKKFSEIKIKLLDTSAGNGALADRYNIVDVCFGQRIKDKVAVDSRTGGRLNLGYDDGCEFVLKIRFKSQKNLLEFYNDDRHSEIRHMIYGVVSPVVDVVFRDLKLFASAPIRSGIFELAEAEMTRYLRRRDFLVGDEIENIVAQDPYQW